MPLINVKLIEDVFTPEQKRRIVEELTDAMVAIEGESMRQVTWVVVEEVRSGDWGIAGKPLTTQDVRALVALLDPDATVVADGGGLASAALSPIEGAGQIARYLTDLAVRALGNMTIVERTVNGQPGLIAQHNGTTVTVFAFDITGDRITRIWAIRNPDKLRPWTTG